MNETSIHTNNLIFEKIKLSSSEGEYWYARDLMSALGYDKWDNFLKVIKKSMIAMSKTYPQVEDHFLEIKKMIIIAKGTDKETKRPTIDYKLTRYACYLIAQNGDSSKNQIAQAQSYFALQTRTQELEQEKKRTIERIAARQKLRETEKKLSGVLTAKGLSGKDIAEVRSAGDESLFNMSTREIKNKLGIQNDSLADHLPTITIKAKDLAAEITTFNTKEKSLNNKESIKSEHRSNNQSIRSLLNEKGIYPENLAAEVDISKLEKRLSENELAIKKTNDFVKATELLMDIRNLVDEEELLRIKHILESNIGDVQLKIIYGNNNNPKVIIRKVSISRSLVNGLRKYLVLENNS